VREEDTVETAGLAIPLLVFREIGYAPGMFSRIANRREVWSWGMYDLANQSFALMINTLLFGIFLKATVLDGARAGDFVWSLMGAVSLGAVVLAGPPLGAVADARALKKRFLVVTGAACAVLTCGLALVPTASAVGVPWALAVAVILYVPANIAFNVGENFLAAFLPEVSTRQNMGLVSALGWTMGFLGALALLGILAWVSWQFGIRDPAGFRSLFLLAGGWFGVMMLPTVLFLKEKAVPRAVPAGTSVAKEALARLGRTIRETGRFRDLAALLGAFLVYGMGMQVIVFFAGVIAQDDFGFTPAKLVSFTAVVTVTGAAGAILTGAVQDRFGHKPTLLVYLAVWTATAAGLAWLVWIREAVPEAERAALPSWPIWAVGNGIGFGLGGMGTATRATVGVLTPAQRTAEFFNLWGCTNKMAGVIGLPLFGAVRSAWGSVPSFVALTGFFVLGAILVAVGLRVPRGIAAAQAAEREGEDAA
jgi:UMF1 family MFS transporter